MTNTEKQKIFNLYHEYYNAYQYYKTSGKKQGMKDAATGKYAIVQLIDELDLFNEFCNYRATNGLK